jgi:hypothetical protein
MSKDRLKTFFYAITMDYQRLISKQRDKIISLETAADLILYKLTYLLFI